MTRLWRIMTVTLGAVLVVSAAACSKPAAPRMITPGTAAPSATVAASAGPTRWAGSTGDVRAPMPTPGKVMLGTFIALKSMSTAQGLALRKQQIGRDPRFVQWFYEWADQLPTSFPNLPANAIPLVTWRGTYYSSILNGSQDALIAAQADRVAKYDKPVFIRWAWEMNGSWYLWGGPKNDKKPSDFIAAWRHVHQIFLAHGATNVAWVWAPNWYSLPNEAWNDLRNYYPGDDYVDWVGISGYGDTGLTPEKLFDSFYNEYASRKPIMIPETGAIDRGGTTKADWFEVFRQWVKNRPSIAAVCFYDTDHSPGTPENFRVDSSPETLATFRNIANDPYFGG